MSEARRSVSDLDYDPQQNTRPAWVDEIPVPEPYDSYDNPDYADYGGAFDGFTVTSDADPGL